MITPNERNALLTWARQHGRPFTAIQARRSGAIRPDIVRRALADLVRVGAVAVRRQPKPFALQYEVNR